MIQRPRRAVRSLLQLPFRHRRRVRLQNSSFLTQNSSILIHNFSCLMQNSSFFAHSFGWSQLTQLSPSWNAYATWRRNLRISASKLTQVGWWKAARSKEQVVRALPEVPGGARPGPSRGCAKFIVFSTDFIIYNTDFIILNAEFIILNAEFVFFCTNLCTSPAGAFGSPCKIHHF